MKEPDLEGLPTCFYMHLTDLWFCCVLAVDGFARGRQHRSTNVMGIPEHGTLPTKLNESQTTQPDEEEVAF